MSEKIISMHKDIIYNTIVRLCKEYKYDLSYVTQDLDSLDVVHIEFYGEQKEYPFCTWNFNQEFFNTELKPFFNKLNKGD